MLARLIRVQTDGYIERRPRKGPVLTAKGRAEAERVVRNHRIIERFLTDFMGYTPAESHVHTDDMGDAFTDEMVEHLSVQLGHPDRCPHGWPVDTAHEKEENAVLTSLAKIEAGGSAKIVRLAEHDGDLLHWFYDEGFVPGSNVEIREAQPAAGQLKVVLGDDERAIADKAAQGLYVRPAA